MTGSRTEQSIQSSGMRGDRNVSQPASSVVIHKLFRSQDRPEQVLEDLATISAFDLTQDLLALGGVRVARQRGEKDAIQLLLVVQRCVRFPLRELFMNRVARNQVQGLHNV